MVDKNGTVEFVCPVCHSGLVTFADGSRQCLDASCRARYHKRSSVDVFLSDIEWTDLTEKLSAESRMIEAYSSGRRGSLLTVKYYDWWCRQLFELVPSRYESLLEIMSGGCELTRRMPIQFKKGFALDLNLVLLERAAKHFEEIGDQRIVTVCANANRIPFPSESFGTVMVQGGLHHARPILKEVLSEVYRVLKPDGIFIASEPANDSSLIRMVRSLVYRASWILGCDDDEQGFTRDELLQALMACNFRLETYQPIGYIGYALMVNTDVFPLLRGLKLNVLGDILISLDKLFARIHWVRQLGWASMFSATKMKS